ncbi:NAD(P)/FAD-dependent oxidoreductase [Nonomuraea rhizosphaerae]|uniref:NAD(P)/FAD-dependent oxidoreductase n=1 Tax=Nonomuraea rhizosphaerae TaxID=2665663 RepID=UPI001C5F312C|nr:NAD(P)/FAD-dependent oxidoreductase [Nonomuraea rhizosphaerae]
MTYDVVIVGAGVAGCTAAILYGRAGLRVALIEKHHDISTHKALCGHFILAGTQPMLRRTGLWEAMVEAGAVTGHISRWTSAGWFVPDPGLPEAISLRREKLDPLLRTIASGTPGVDLLLGRTVTALLESEPALLESGPGLLESGDRVTDVSDGRVTGVRGGRIAGARRGQAAGARSPRVTAARSSRVTAARAAPVTGASGSRVVGVRVGDEEIHARLVIGADGHRSTVARLAGVTEDIAPNERFGWWAYYRGVVPSDPGGNQIWALNPDVGILIRTDDDLHMLVAFPVKARIGDFQADRAAALERFMVSLPDAPDLSSAERVSKVIGANDYPCVRRDPVPRPGLMLVGDAAITGDPTPAVGCGWAFRAAEWLVTCTAPALRSGTDPDAGSASYRQALRFIEEHDRLGRQDAQGKPMNAVQRLIARAAMRDPEIGRRVYLFSMRATPVKALINPGTLLRALWAVIRP